MAETNPVSGNGAAGQPRHNIANVDALYKFAQGRGTKLSRDEFHSRMDDPARAEKYLDNLIAKEAIKADDKKNFMSRIYEGVDFGMPPSPLVYANAPEAGKPQFPGVREVKVPERERSQGTDSVRTDVGGGSRPSFSPVKSVAPNTEKERAAEAAELFSGQDGRKTPLENMLFWQDQYNAAEEEADRRRKAWMPASDAEAAENFNKAVSGEKESLEDTLARKKRQADANAEADRYTADFVEPAKREYKKALGNYYNDRRDELYLQACAAEEKRNNGMRADGISERYIPKHRILPYDERMEHDPEFQRRVREMARDMSDEEADAILSHGNFYRKAYDNYAKGQRINSLEEDASAWSRMLSGIVTAFDKGKGLYTLGLSGMADAWKAKNALDRVKAGEGTEADEAYLRSIYDKGLAEGIFDGGTAYNVGQAAWGSLEFMLDMLVTGAIGGLIKKGVGAGAKGLGRWISKSVGKDVAKDISKEVAEKAAKNAGGGAMKQAVSNFADNVIGAPLSPQVHKGAAERQIENYAQGYDANNRFAVMEYENPESMWASYLYSGLGYTLEAASEKLVGPLWEQGVKAVKPVLSRPVARVAGDRNWYRNVSAFVNGTGNALSKRWRALRDRISVEGLSGETFEEVVNEPLQRWLVAPTAQERYAMEQSGGSRWDGMYSGDWWAETVGTCALIQLGFATPQMLANGAYTADNIRLMNKYIRQLPEDMAQRLKKAALIDDADSRNEAVAEAMRGATDKQRTDAAKYLIAREGRNLGLSYRMAEATNQGVERLYATLSPLGDADGRLLMVPDKETGQWYVSAAPGALSDDSRIVRPVEVQADGMVAVGRPRQVSTSSLNVEDSYFTDVDAYVNEFTKKRAAASEAEGQAVRAEDELASRPAVRRSDTFVVDRAFVYTDERGKQQAAGEWSTIVPLADVAEGSAPDTPVSVVITKKGGSMSKAGVIMLGELQDKIGSGEVKRRALTEEEAQAVEADKGDLNVERSIPEAETEAVAEAGTEVAGDTAAENTDNEALNANGSGTGAGIETQEFENNEVVPAQTKAEGESGVAKTEGGNTENEILPQEEAGGTAVELYDNQGNPIDENGELVVEPINSIEDLTDEDFENPTRNVQLPPLPENVSDAIGSDGKPVVIKKSIFEKNKDVHPEFDPQDSRSILTRALYNPDLAGLTQPKTRPYYRVVIQTGDMNAVVVLDVYENKGNTEIVGWREMNERGLEKLKRQAEREDGQLLILSPGTPSGSAAALSALPSDLSSADKGTQVSEENKVQLPENPVASKWAALVEANEGDEAEALDTALQMVGNKTAELEQARKTVAKGKTEEAIQEAKRAKREKVSALETELQFWKDVAGYPEKKRASEAQAAELNARLERERKRKEQQASNPNYGLRQTEADDRLGAPLSLREYVVRKIATGRVKFLWSGSESGTGGLKEHGGAAKRQMLYTDKTRGQYPEDVAEAMRLDIADNYPELGQVEASDILSEIENLSVGEQTPSEMMEEAERLHERSRRAGTDTEAEEAAREEAAIEEARAEQARASVEELTPEEYSAVHHAAPRFAGDMFDETGRPRVEADEASDEAVAVVEAEAQVDTNPTDGQKEAGNYRKGHVRVNGLDITIENPKGSVRSGVDGGGKPWRTVMHNTYGYIRGTEGVDGDHIDVFLSDNPYSGEVFVVDQVNPQTGAFDEHKVMMGFDSEEEARRAYLSNYSDGWQGLGNITRVSQEDFRKWLDSSHRKTKPFAEYKGVRNVVVENAEETQDGDIRMRLPKSKAETTVTPPVDTEEQEGKPRFAGEVFAAEGTDARAQMWSAEEAEIERSAKADGTWLKAPNGKPTKLTPGQWVQVRTKAFKDWFVDWELAAKAVNIVSAMAEHGFKNFAEARDWAKKNIVGVVKHNEIGDINISGTSIEKYLSEKAVDKSDNKDVHLSALKVLPDVIKNSVVGEIHADKNNSRNVRDIVRLFGCIDIAGKEYRVKTTVKRYKSDNEKTKAYSYEITEIELLDGTPGDDRSPLPRTSSNSISVAKLLQGVKKSNSEEEILNTSKVVDENGEPLVVYHGTEAQFSIFRHNPEDIGFHFGNKKIAISRVGRGRNARHMQTYIRIKNPLVIDTDLGSWSADYLVEYLLEKGEITKQEAAEILIRDSKINSIDPSSITANNVRFISDTYRRGDSDANAKIRNWLRSKGYDGIQYSNYYESNGKDSWIVFSPTQIKSATDNVGTFDAGNPDIRYRFAGDMFAEDGMPKNDDAAYLAAVERGDTETAQRMVNEAAARAGYNAPSDYQGSLAFNGAAPSKNGYFDTKEERKAAWENGEYEGEMSLGDFMDSDIDTNDLGWQLTDPIAKRNGSEYTRESIDNLSSAVKSGKRTIKMYRAVDASVKENSFRNGDWVTPSRKYAQYHIGLQDWKEGRIIEQEVSVDDIWWDGDDINEWGYDDGKDYGYGNTENNRKLLDAVTRDDAGDIIPLSRRFDQKKSDARYRFIGEKGAAAKTSLEAKRQAALDAGASLGVPIVVEEAPAGGRRRAKDEALGWFDVRTGAVHVNPGNHADAEDVKRTVMHEAVGHMGIRRLLEGKHPGAYDAFLDRVHAAMPAEAQAYFLDYARRSQAGRPLTEAELNRIAADEYVAALAEVGGEANVWQRVVAEVRELLRRIGFDIDLSEADIRALIYESKHNLESAAYYAEREMMRREQKEYRDEANLSNRLDEAGRDLSDDEDYKSVESPTQTIEEEEAEIERSAKADGTWLKAPNGKPTKLTPRQWVQVRTKAFKDWFGDWELANFYNRAVEAWQNNESKGKVVFGLSERAKARFNELLGKDVQQLIITDDAIRHIRNNHSEREELRGQKNMTPEDVVVIPYLVNNFDSMELSPKYDDNQGNRAIEIHKRINGVSVIATIEKGKNKEFLVTSYQFVKSDALDASNETPGPNVRNDSDLAKVQKDIKKIKDSAANSSKVVDENGEPLVVYHGTNAEFNTFRHQYPNSIGYWFISSKTSANAHGYIVKETFINLRNPANTQEERAQYENDLWGTEFDGLIIENENRSVPIIYVVRGNGQIKSATDNTGAFSNETSDIRFRRAGTSRDGRLGVVSIDADSNGRYGAWTRQGLFKRASDVARYFLDDSLPLRHMMTHIKRSVGGVVTDATDLWRQKTMVVSRARYRIDEYNRKIGEPLMKTVRGIYRATKEMAADYLGDLSKGGKAGKAYYIDLYLMAKHIPERNAWMAENRDDGKSDYAGAEGFKARTGMTPEEYSARFEKMISDAGLDGDLAEMWRLINASTDFSLRQRVDDGLMDKDFYESIKARGWQYYVPLRSWDERNMQSPEYTDMEYPLQVDAMNDTFTNNVKRAKGRHSLADNPLAYIFRDAETAITLGETNRFRQAVAKLRDDNSKLTYIFGSPKFLEGKETMLEERSHFVTYYEDGKRKQVGFVNPMLAAAIRGDRERKRRNWMKPMQWWTRIQSALNTSLNPAFALTNAARDIQFGIFSRFVESANPIEGIAASAAFIYELIRNLPAAVAASTKEGTLKGSFFRPDIIEAWRKNGGETGWHALNDLRETKDKLYKGITSGKMENGAKAVLTAIPATFRVLTEVSENAVRLAAFSDAKRRGMSDQGAASYSKEITTNFNRHSRIAQDLGPLYMFLNAQTQGIYRFLSLAKENPGNFAMASIGMVAAGLLMSMAAALNSGDDDDEKGDYLDRSEFLRFNNFIFGNFLLPVAHNARMFYGIGAAVGDYIMGHSNENELAFNLMQITGRELLPGILNATDWLEYDPASRGSRFDPKALAAGIAPSAIVPIVEGLTNRNFMGSPIYQEQSVFVPYAPRVARSRKDVNPFLLNLTEAVAALDGYNPEVNKKTGFRADKKRTMRGIADWNASAVEHAITSLAGGTGKFINDIDKLVRKWRTEGEDIEASDIPILKSFVRPISEDAGLYNTYNRLSDQKDLWEKALKERLENISSPGISGDSRRMSVNDYVELQRSSAAGGLKEFAKYEEAVKRLLDAQKEYGETSDVVRDMRKEIMRMANSIENRAIREQNAAQADRMEVFEDIRKDRRGIIEDVWDLLVRRGRAGKTRAAE